MAVNLYILERQRSVLSVAGFLQEIGILRRFWKLTEMNPGRIAEVDAAAAYAFPAPQAVMLAEVEEDYRLASSPLVPIKSHLVLGWDAGRSSVTDWGWEYLPVVGYAVREVVSQMFELHEVLNGSLHLIDNIRATELRLISEDGKLRKCGQPMITSCRGVKAYIDGYAEADCSLEGGRIEKLLISVTNGTYPEPSWLVGKTPMQIKNYPPSRPSSQNTINNLLQP